MATATANGALTERLQAFCTALTATPEFDAIRLRVDQFMINDAAKRQYQDVSERGGHLEHKQSQGVTLDPAEIAEFEKQRDALLANPVARGFVEAQEEIQGIQEQVMTWVNKTLELGRVPEAEEVGGGGCGHGCGCHH